MVTTGSQQLLYLLGEVLLDPGDIVITEAPSYFVYHGVLAGNGVRVLTVPMDDDGMNTDDLEELLERLDRAGELRPREADLHGRLLPEPDRPDAVAPNAAGSWSRSPSDTQSRHRILILEDAAYRELRYEGDDLPSVKRFDPDNRLRHLRQDVLQAVRPGPEDRLRPAAARPDRAAAPPEGQPRLRLDQPVAAHHLTGCSRPGRTTAHVAYLRGVYRHKRDAMLEALEREFGDWPGVRGRGRAAGCTSG